MFKLLLYPFILVVFLGKMDDSFKSASNALCLVVKHSFISHYTPASGNMNKSVKQGKPATKSKNLEYVDNIESYYFSSFVAGLLFCGVLGVLAFFILLLYLKSREHIYFYYFLFLIFNLIGCILNLSSYSLNNSITYARSGLAERNLEAVTMLALFAYCIFAINLLNIKKQAPNLAKWIIYLAGLTSVYGILYWFIYPEIKEQATLFFIISRSVILPMSLIAIIWVVYKVHSVFKGYFLIGSAFYFTGALLAVLRETAPNIPLRNFYEFSPTVYFQSGILLETICFAMALSHRIYLLYKSKQKEQEMINVKTLYERDLAQAQILASRMKINPHFIFNSLNAIKYLIQSHKNEKATKYLSVFSRFVRMVLETGEKNLIPLSEEIEMVRHYLILEANRFDENFTYKIRIGENIDTNNITTPPMLLQPFIENAIWHGLLSSNKAVRELTIEIMQVDSSITVLIKDNGMGWANKSLSNPENFHKATGTKITKERIDLYNKNYKGKISSLTKNKINEKGEITGTETMLIIINGKGNE